MRGAISKVALLPSGTRGTQERERQKEKEREREKRERKRAREVSSLFK